MIASYYDVLWINIKNEKEVDIDNMFSIGYIKAILNHDSHYYILVNKLKKKTGIFVLVFHES